MNNISYLTQGSLFLSLKIILNVYVIATDHAAYSFAEKVYNIVANKILKAYPLYSFILEDKELKQVLEIVGRGSYILDFKILSKRGAYLAKPRAIVLYSLAKKANFDMVLAGSSYED